MGETRNHLICTASCNEEEKIKNKKNMKKKISCQDTAVSRTGGYEVYGLASNIPKSQKGWQVSASRTYMSFP